MVMPSNGYIFIFILLLEMINHLTINFYFDKVNAFMICGCVGDIASAMEKGFFLNGIPIQIVRLPSVLMLAD